MLSRAGTHTGLLGATAAAEYLGISRTTLHRETVNGKVVPDLVTRGGLRRYTTATLDAYRRRYLGRGPSAAGTAPDAGHWASLAQIARLAAAGATEKEICDAALPLIYAALPGTEFAYVALSTPPAYEARAMRSFTHGELGAQMSRVFGELGPRDGYLTPRLIARGEMVHFDDLVNDPVLRGTESDIFVRESGIRSFLGVPMRHEDLPIGLLGLGSRQPHLFRTGDVPYVTAAAEILAGALTAQRLRADLAQAHTAITQLAAVALRPGPVGGRPRDEERRAQLQLLIDLFRMHSGAHAVGIQGLGCDVIPAHQQLSALMQSVLTPGLVTPCPHNSQERGQACTCLAIGVARPDGAPGVVGATWRGPRPFTAQDGALLASFAAACLLILLRLA